MMALWCKLAKKVAQERKRVNHNMTTLFMSLRRKKIGSTREVLLKQIKRQEIVEV